MIYRFILPMVFSTLVYGTEVISSECHMSVETLISKTLSTHPSIRMSRQMIKGADAQVESAKWGYFPTPSIDYSQRSGRNGTTARLDQPIWTGGKLDASMDMALSKKVETEFALDESSYTLIQNILNAVQLYLRSEGNLLALEEGKEQLRGFEEMLQRRIDAGVSSIADHELIKSRLAQIDSDMMLSYSSRNTALSQLALLTGSPIQCTVTARYEKSLGAALSLEEMREQMMQTHPSLKRLSAQIKTAEAEKAKAKAVLWPNLSLRAEHQSGSVYSDQGNTNNLVYLTLQASPGAGLSAFTNIESAEAKVLQVEFEKQTKERELTDTLMRDYHENHAAHERIDGLNKTIDASQKVLDSYTRLFIAGKRQWLDLVNSSREVTQNKLSLADQKAILAVSSYRLLLSRGEIRIESGEEK